MAMPIFLRANGLTIREWAGQASTVSQEAWATAGSFSLNFCSQQPLGFHFHSWSPPEVPWCYPPASSSKAAFLLWAIFTFSMIAEIVTRWAPPAALIPDRTTFCAFTDSRLRVFLPVTTYLVVEKPDLTKAWRHHARNDQFFHAGRQLSWQ